MTNVIRTLIRALTARLVHDSSSGWKLQRKGRNIKFHMLWAYEVIFSMVVVLIRVHSSCRERSGERCKSQEKEGRAFKYLCKTEGSRRALSLIGCSGTDQVIFG